MGNGEQDQETVLRAEENALYYSSERQYERHRARILGLFGVEVEDNGDDEEGSCESMEDEPKVPQ